MSKRRGFKTSRMRWIDILRISVRLLRRNLLRTILTTIGIATAVGLIVVLVGIGYGVQSVTIGSIVESKSLLSLEVMKSGENTPLSPSQELVSQIKDMEGVANVSPVFVSEGQVQFEGKRVSNALLAGTADLPIIEGVSLSQGRYYNEGANEIVISQQTLDLLEKTGDQLLGQEITFSFVNSSAARELVTLGQPLTVVGITNGSALPNIFIPYDLIATTPNIEMTSIKVVGKDRASVVALQAAIQAKGFLVETLIETLDSANLVFRWITGALALIALIALVVSAIGMLNTLTIALLERTREIGIMKAIGIVDRDIMRLFLSDAIIIGLMGGMLGIGIGLSADWLLNSIFNRFANHYSGTALDLFNYPDFFLLGMVIFPVFLGIITGLYPAIRASKLNPLQALRYE